MDGKSGGKEIESIINILLGKGFLIQKSVKGSSKR